MLVAIRGYPRIPGQPVGPALFPGLIAAGLCIAGAADRRGLRHRGEQPWLAWDDWVRSPRHALALLVLLGSVMFYIVAAEVLSFLPTAAIILTVLFLVLRVRRCWRWSPWWRRCWCTPPSTSC